MDQLSLDKLCHSKLGPLHPQPGELFFFFLFLHVNGPRALPLLTKMLSGRVWTEVCLIVRQKTECLFGKQIVFIVTWTGTSVKNVNTTPEEMLQSFCV